MVIDEFEILMQTQGKGVYPLALRLTGNPVDGEDLAQETFVRAYKNFDKFRGDAKFSTWVYRICVNLWKNRVRYEKKRSFRQMLSLNRNKDDDDQAALEVPSNEPGPEGTVAQEERHRILHAALSSLENDDRLVILLREGEDKSYEEIAEILKMPMGTVKSRLSRARERLRTALKPHLSEVK